MKKRYAICGLTLLTALIVSPLMAQDPYQKADDSWISISGTVVSASADSFILDYGDGLITVEMDGWDWYRQDFSSIEDNNVTVYGRVDDDLFELTTIEASSVYDKNKNTFYYASAKDEEDFDYINTTIVSREGPWMTLTGTVTDVVGREFTINTGERRMKVDTIMMNYNPLDNKGYPQISIGDRVTVSGNIDYNVFEKRELEAEIITKLEENRKTI